MSKLKIFVSAYACEPGLGSEIGVGWHWVLEMSKHFDLWVLTRESNRHSIEPWIAAHPEFGHIRFLYFDLPNWARFWKKGLRGVRLYYNLWQGLTNPMVRRTMQENGIRVFHHLTYGNVLWTVSRYGRKQCFIWGPVGGLETISYDYSKHYGWKSRLIEFIRRSVVAGIGLNVGFKNRCRCADIILCKTEITRGYIPDKYKYKSVLQTDVAVEKYSINEQKTDNNGIIKYLVVGRLDAWRGFDLCIESFAEAAKVCENIQLSIVGSGLDEKRLKKLAYERGVCNKIHFMGRVSTEEYRNILSSTDVVINPSLKEGAVTVAFDSMSMGKPLICLDTTGYTRYFSPEYAEIIPIGKRETVIECMKLSILKLFDPSIRKKMGQKAMEAGLVFTWQFRGEEFCRLLSDKLKQNGCI